MEGITYNKMYNNSIDKIEVNRGGGEYIFYLKAIYREK